MNLILFNHFRDHVPVKDERNAAIAFVPSEMKTGYFHDIQLDGNVVYMQIGRN